MIIQIKKTLKRKTAKDISFYEVLARLLATMIFSAKYLMVSDKALIIGSSIFNITFLVYFIIICVVMVQEKKPAFIAGFLFYFFI
jgi:hypothetical protein